MPYDIIFREAEEKMVKTLSVLSEELKGVRTGRATPSLVENLRVSYYGSPTPLKHLAAISAPDPRMLAIKPFDPSGIGDIEKAISSSDLGLTPQNDGKMIRLQLPPLSEERRNQLVKLARDLGEKAKVSLRNIRRDAIRSAEEEEKTGQMSEDDKFRFKDDAQELTTDHEKKVEELIRKKSDEVLEV